jgi:hypothetical protein
MENGIDIKAMLVEQKVKEGKNNECYKNVQK